jgi:hypothetical protein
MHDETSPDRGTNEAGDARGTEDEIPLPVGTLFLMMIYIMIMAGMWLAMYFEFLGR